MANLIDSLKLCALLTKAPLEHVGEKLHRLFSFMNLRIMGSEKHKLQVHCTNLFTPKPLGITHMAVDESEELIAVVKRLYYKNDQENLKVRYIEIYRMPASRVPKIVHSFVEQEQITGIGWLSQDLLLTVSLEQTISIHSIVTGEKIFSTITDYGPITCMKLVLEHNLLLTGTEYGYVSAYRIEEGGKSVEHVNRMVKINNSIEFIDLHIVDAANRSRTKAKIVPNKPTKRKHLATSDGESEDEDASESEFSKEFLGGYEVMIYGASGADVIVWDYHKKTIIDTAHIGQDISVTVLLALSSGEVVVGDSSGIVSVLDTNTFTCRYTSKVLPFKVLSLTKNSSESSLLVAGQESTIIIMKKDKPGDDEYRLKETIESQTNQITSLIYLSKKKFLFGSMEGIIGRFKRGKENRLERAIIGPKYTDKISFFDGEMMFHNPRSLVIWKLLKIDRETSDPIELTNLQPTKVVNRKTKNIIRSCTFDDKHIVHSGPHGLYVYQRDTKLDKPTISLPNCTRLKICGDYLIACTNSNLTVIDLKRDQNQDNGQPKACEIVAQYSLESIVQHLLYMSADRQLVVACGPNRSLIYRLNLNPDMEDERFSISGPISLTGDRISCMAYDPSDQSNQCVFLYMDSDKMMKLNLASTISESKLQRKLDGRGSVVGLPKDVYILGMLILTKDYGILYDSECLYKIDINRNEIVNSSSNYNHIVALDNQVSGDPQDIALAGMSLDDYRALIPSALPTK